MNLVIEDILPILILLFLGIAALSTAVILKIHAKKNLLGGQGKDFIDLFIERKKRQLNANIGGLTWNEYIALLILLPSALAFIGYMLLSNKAMCIILVFTGLFLPEVFVRISVKRSKQAFEERYASALRTLASSLRSGLSIEQAIEDVGKNPFVDAHIKNGFRQISSDIKVGIPLEQAFLNFAKESGSPDAKDVAAALTMQAKVGGNEAFVVSTIAQNISERIMVRKEIKSLFADTDMLILVMDFIPYLLILLLYYGTPQLLNPFFEDPFMLAGLIGLIILTTVGSFIIHKMASGAKEG